MLNVNYFKNIARKADPGDVNSKSSTGDVASKPSSRNPQKSQEHDNARMNKLKSLIQADDVPITFYGIVVDQDDEPVADAAVRWRISKPGYFSSPPGTIDTIITNRDGRFAVSGETGRTFRIENIAKEGYRQASSTYGVYSYGSVSGGPHIPDANNPERFVVVNNNFPKVKYIEGKKFTLVWNNGVNRIPLGVNELDLLVKAKRDKRAGKENDFLWEVEFSIAGADLAKVDGNYLTFAPSAGYRESISLHNDAKNPSAYVNTSDLILVFRTKSGLFGKVVFTLYPDRDNNALYLSTYLNQYGKRNLY